MSMQRVSAVQVLNTLLRLPRMEWGSTVKGLSPDLKNQVFQLLISRRGTSESAAPSPACKTFSPDLVVIIDNEDEEGKEDSTCPTALTSCDNSLQQPLTVKVQESESKSIVLCPDCDEPKQNATEGLTLSDSECAIIECNDSGTVKREVTSIDSDRRKCENPKVEEQNFVSSQSNPLHFTPSPCDPNIVNVSRVPVLRSTPMSVLGRAMFVAGDGLGALPESISVVHQYLNSWIACLWHSFVLHCPPPVRRASTPYNWWTNKKLPQNIRSFLEIMYPTEIAKYDTNLMLHKSAKKLARNPTKDAVAPVAATEIITHVGAIASSLKKSQSSYSTETSTSVGSKRPEVAVKIIPADRFDKRLEFRDIRTKSMSAEEYSTYTKARENATGSRHVISDWLRMCASLHKSDSTKYPRNWPKGMEHANLSKVALREGTKNPAPLIPKTSTLLLVSIVTDRINSIVELALRLRHRQRQLRLSFKLDEVATDDKLDLASFDDVIHQTRKENQAVVSAASSDTNAVLSSPVVIHPDCYKAATQLIFKHVDSADFNLEGKWEDVGKEWIKTQHLRKDQLLTPLKDTGRKRRHLASTGSLDDDVSKKIKVFETFATDSPDASLSAEGVKADSSSVVKQEISAVDEKLVFDAICREAVKRYGPACSFGMPDEFGVFCYFNSAACLMRHMTSGGVISQCVRDLKDKFEAEKLNDTVLYRKHCERFNMLCQYAEGLQKIECLSLYLSKSAKSKRVKRKRKSGGQGEVDSRRWPSRRREDSGRLKEESSSENEDEDDGGSEENEEDKNWEPPGALGGKGVECRSEDDTDDTDNDDCDDSDNGNDCDDGEDSEDSGVRDEDEIQLPQSSEVCGDE